MKLNYSCNLKNQSQNIRDIALRESNNTKNHSIINDISSNNIGNESLLNFNGSKQKELLKPSQSKIISNKSNNSTAYQTSIFESGMTIGNIKQEKFSGKIFPQQTQHNKQNQKNLEVLLEDDLSYGSFNDFEGNEINKEYNNREENNAISYVELLNKLSLDYQKKTFIMDADESLSKDINFHSDQKIINLNNIKMKLRGDGYNNADFWNYPPSNNYNSNHNNFYINYNNNANNSNNYGLSKGINDQFINKGNFNNIKVNLLVNNNNSNNNVLYLHHSNKAKVISDNICDYRSLNKSNFPFINEEQNNSIYNNSYYNSSNSNDRNNYHLINNNIEDHNPCILNSNNTSNNNYNEYNKYNNMHAKTQYYNTNNTNINTNNANNCNYNCKIISNTCINNNNKKEKKIISEIVIFLLLSNKSFYEILFTKKGSQDLQNLISDIIDYTETNTLDSNNYLIPINTVNTIQINPYIQQQISLLKNKVISVSGKIISDKYGAFAFQKFLLICTLSEKLRIWEIIKNYFLLFCFDKIGNNSIQEMINKASTIEEQLAILKIVFNNNNISSNNYNNNSNLINLSCNEYGYHILIRILSEFYNINNKNLIYYRKGNISNNTNNSNNSHDYILALRTIINYSTKYITDKYGVNVIKKLISTLYELSNNLLYNDTVRLSFKQLIKELILIINNNLSTIIKQKYGYYALIYLITNLKFEYYFEILKNFINNIESLCINSYAYKLFKKMIKCVEEFDNKNKVSHQLILNLLYIHSLIPISINKGS